MDALTAGMIVALVGAIALIAVAFLTARARIGMLPKKAAGHPSGPSLAPTDLPESARRFRGLGWLLVVFLYLAGTFCWMQGLNDLQIFFHWDRWEAAFGSLLDDRSEIALYSKFWITTGVVLFFIGYWAQRRLRRRAA